MAERCISVDHSTIHRWVVHFSPWLVKRYNLRKRKVTGKWHMDETNIKVRGQWTYQKARFAFNPTPSIAEQFEILAS